MTESLKQDLTKHNSQYPPIMLTEKKNIHDRFLIVDEDVYHIGASMKDLEKKLFRNSTNVVIKRETVEEAEYPPRCNHKNS